MRDVVVDVQVMMSASGLGDEVHAPESLEFLTALKTANTVLKLDDEGLIANQYREKIGTTSFAAYLIRSLIDRERVAYVSRVTVSGSVRAELAKSGLHVTGEDFHYYVRTTAATEEKVLVSHDPAYRGKLLGQLKRRLGVDAISAVACTDRVA